MAADTDWLRRVTRRARASALLLLFCAGEVAAATPVEGLRGAHAVLDALPRAQRPADAAPDATDLVWRMLGEQAGAADKLTADIGAFALKMPPDKNAGTHWIALFERWYALRHPTPDENRYIGVEIERLFDALPPPDQWPAMAAKLRAAHAIKSGAEPTMAQIAVLAFSDKLAGDNAALKQRLAQFDAAARKSASKGADDESEWLETLTKLLGSDADSERDPVERFAARIHRQASSTQELSVPDLITLASEARAKELLLQALTQSGSRLDIAVGDATRSLAAKLALENIDTLRVAQWNLVRGLDCAPLFEALQHRFGVAPHGGGGLSLLLGFVGLDGPTHDDYLAKRAVGQARMHYFGALIAHDRAADAERVAQEFDDEISPHDLRTVLDALDRAGYTLQVYEFLDRFLAHHPASDLWSGYFEFAARSGKQDLMLAHVRANLAAPESKDHASTLRAHLIDALLAADKVEEAVAETNALLADPLASAAQRSRYGLKLAELGRLYERPEWIEHGLAADQPRSPGIVSGEGDPLIERVRLLVKLHRYAEAESLLAGQLERQHKLLRGPFSGSDRNVLLELAALYHAAGRDADVRVLLDESPNWNATDLAQLLEKYDQRTFVLGLATANALHEAADDAKAQAVLETLIDRFDGADAAYALYTRIRGAAAIAFLDRVQAGDRFEERPLIWKATLLLKYGHLDDAERAAAIAIDPSDGEEGPGDRLRAYAVLADILQARGNGADAQLYRNAVQAIRQSERADEFRLAGLHTHAIELYGKALERFADAYCIQSRLAVELNASGSALLAQEHYRRAYELMPASFGRLESHCLGCENVFGGRTAQEIAEQVFGDLARKTPASPQVHYLLGYLREQQERFSDAFAQYQIAARLDPDYINAWKHQRDIGRRIDLPVAERARVDLRLLELDPRGRHVDVEVDSITDWAALYAVAAKAHAGQSHRTNSVYPLAKGGVHKANSDYDFSYRQDAVSLAPGAVIARTELMRIMTTIM